MGEPFRSLYAGDQALHVSSGVAVLPERVEDFDLGAGRRRASPADRSPDSDHLSVARLRFIRAPRGALHPDPEHLARIRGREVELAAGVAVERGDLLRRGAGHQRRLRRVALEAEQLAAVAGRDHQPLLGVEGDVVRRVVPRLPEFVPQAVGCNAVNGAARRAPIRSRRARRSRRRRRRRLRSM